MDNAILDHGHSERDMEPCFSSPPQNDYENQYLSLKEGSLDDLTSLLECSSRVESPCTSRITRDAACQTIDVTHSMKKAAGSTKRNHKRARATYRERQRVCVLNDAFRRLEEIVPSAQRKMRKIDVLQMASQYIEDMTLMLREDTEN